MESLDFQRIAAAVGPSPGVAYAAAHAYPASAPAYTESPCAERDRVHSDALRLYVHVPYCNYRCTFCFFAVRIGARHQEMERYVRALRRELEWADAGTPLSQLFVGGGTPTALPPDLLDEMLSAIFERLPSEGTNVHVVEASPESITADHVDVLRRRGIGRVSMGTQSLEENVLNDVHRRHTALQTLEACDLVVGSGLILNIDLIYGLPGQTYDSFRRDFSAIAKRGVQSVTVYDLRLNEQTPVARRLADEERLELERLVRWRLVVMQTAADLGFTQTRWHTFKRLDTIASRHKRAPHHDHSGNGYQLGIGMSARSHLGATVYRNHERIPKYLERIEAGRSPVEHVIRLGDDDCRTLYVAHTLGDGKPLDSADYERVFGNSIDDDFGEPLFRLREGGLIEDDNGILRLSEIGRMVHDRLTFNFYPKRVLNWLSERRPAGGMGQMRSR
ncbi:MAG: coproporphyrinogen-III oxidase family protein [Planctomycetaceae bacterium]